MSRNHAIHTSVQQLEQNILAAVRDRSRVNHLRPLSMSQLGYQAFQGYRFKSPQGAALAVSRIVRGLLDRKILARGNRGGVYLSYTAGEETPP